MEAVAEPAEHALHILGGPHDRGEGSSEGAIGSAVGGVEAAPEEFLEVDALGGDVELSLRLVRGVDVAHEDLVAQGHVGPHAVEETGFVYNGASEGGISFKGRLGDALKEFLGRGLEIP